MNTEILGVILQWVALVVLCYPLGRYIAKVYRGERTWLDFMAPLERGIYKVCGIREDEEMDWKQFLKALLMVNLFWFFWGMLLLVFQGYLPMNPDGNPGQTPDLAFNTCISFMVNCNLQHYSGESGLSYFTQIFVIMLFQFITAACGMAAMAGIMSAGGEDHEDDRQLLGLPRQEHDPYPDAALAARWYPAGHQRHADVVRRQADPDDARRSGAGHFAGPHGGHRAHQATGYERRRLFRYELRPSAREPQRLHQHAGVLVDPHHPDGHGLGVRILYPPPQAGRLHLRRMLFAFTAGILISVPQEMGGNPNIDEMGIAQERGLRARDPHRPGRFGHVGHGDDRHRTAWWTRCTIPQTPLSGMMQMLNMQINCWFGGVGVG